MTNEEQAAILSGMAWGFKDGIAKGKYDIAIKMAQWKDMKFDEYLHDKLIKCNGNSANVSLKASLFDEIIKEKLNIEL